MGPQAMMFVKKLAKHIQQELIASPLATPWPLSDKQDAVCQS